MATRFKPSVHLVVGRKLLAVIAGTELMIMLIAGWLNVERWFTPMQFNFVDTFILSITASFVIFYWVIKPLEAASKTIGEYKSLEKMLLASEYQYRNLFENNPQPMFIYDRETLSIFAVNDAAVDQYGYSREAFLAMTVKDLHRPEERAAVVASTVQLTGEIRRPGVWRHKKKDGTLFDADIVTHDMVFDGRAARHVLINDVTEQKKSEKDLRTALHKVADEKAKSEAIIAAIGDGITIQDRDFRIIYQNDIATSHMGNHVGEYCYTAYEGLAHTCEGCPLALSFKDGEIHTSVRSVHTDKGVMYFENTTSALRDADGKIIEGIEVVRDITERKRSEEQIRQQFQQLSALRSIDLAISSSRDIRLTLDIFLEQVMSQLHVDAAGVLLLEPYTKLLEFAAHRGFRTQALKHTQIRLGQGNAGLAALKRSIVHIPDVKSDEAFMRAPHLTDEQFVSYYGVPLIAKGEVKGVLEIFHRSPLHPDEGWQDFLESLALQAAIAIDNAVLFENLERSNLELVMAYDSTIEGWSCALDYRDKETEGHSLRVTELTVKICQAMGMTGRDLTYVRWGALLHDIGKLGVPDNILFKPGKLNDDEWKIMKRHPVLAYELLRPIRYLGPAVDIPYGHHEKWDGTGYPLGLKGDQIPLAARIFSIVDVWDALNSERPYRPAWPKEKIIQYLRDQTGKDFDPKVTEMFVKLLGEGAIR